MKKKRNAPLSPGDLVLGLPQFSLYENPTSTGNPGNRTGLVPHGSVGVVVACIPYPNGFNGDALVLFGSLLGWRTTDNFVRVRL